MHFLNRVTIVNVNDHPRLENVTHEANFTEGDRPLLLFLNVAIVDSDGNDRMT